MFERLWRKIIDRKGISLKAIPGFLLWLLSFPYRIGVRIARNRAGEPERLPLPVLSVGNIVVGGSGKTPMVGFIAQALAEEGIRVGIVSSGYGRSDHTAFEEPGYKVQKRPVHQTGDEVMILALQVPDAVFSVHTDKTAAAKALAASGEVDVIIVDDGFQHFTLARNIDLVTYDAAVKSRWLKMFPAGILREPATALERADIIVITRSNFARDIQKLTDRLQKANSRADLYQAQFSTSQVTVNGQVMAPKYLRDKSVFLFAGVGNFRALKKQVRRLAGDIDYALELADHQRYDQTLLKKIRRLAEEHDADLLVTTAKDYVKLGDFDFGLELCYLDLVIDLNPGEEKLVADIVKRLELRVREP